MSFKSKYLSGRKAQFFIDRTPLNHYSTQRFAGSPLPAGHPQAEDPPFLCLFAQVAELVDALASGASEQLAREGSSPFLGTSFHNKSNVNNQKMKDPGFRGFFYSGTGARVPFVPKKPAIHLRGRVRNFITVDFGEKDIYGC